MHGQVLAMSQMQLGKGPLPQCLLDFGDVVDLYCALERDPRTEVQHTGAWPSYLTPKFHLCACHCAAPPWTPCTRGLPSLLFHSFLTRSLLSLSGGPTPILFFYGLHSTAFKSQGLWSYSATVPSQGTLPYRSPRTQEQTDTVQVEPQREKLHKGHCEKMGVVMRITSSAQGTHNVVC